MRKMLGLEQVINALSPKGVSEKILYGIDLVCLSVGFLNMEVIKEGLGLYILAITAISITVTLGVKIYNICTPNKKDIKLGKDEEN